MNLLHMGSEMQLLVYACADALKTLKVNAADICGKKRCSEARGFFPTIFLQAGTGIWICLETSLSGNSKPRPSPSSVH